MMKWLNILLLVLLVSCKKKPLPPDTVHNFTNGVLVLNEGLYLQNNASLTWFSKSENKTYQQVFKQVNDRNLGDTANDFELFELNGKTYIIIAVDVSSQLEIIDATSMASVIQIPSFYGPVARQPRRVGVKDDVAYIANYEGTVSVLDLVSLSINKTITVGANPDGLYLGEDLVYVTNSGGLNPPNYDSTISVISMTSHNVIQTIITEMNCVDIIGDSQFDLYFLSKGNYVDVPPNLIRLNTLTNEMVSYDIPVRAMSYCNDCVYFYREDDQSIWRMNLLTEEIDDLPIIDCSSYETFYDLQVDPDNDLIYTIDANGYVNSSVIRAYDLSGNFQFSFTAGLNATEFIFL